MSDQDVERAIEPEIAEAVQSVANRYGARGLEDLIVLAQEQLEVARAALAALEEIAAEPE
jgi:hypothetical protein